jgi:hypothetical protein
MASSYDPPDSSKHIRDWLAATSPRHSDRSRPSTSGDSRYISERSTTGRLPSSDRSHNRSGASKRPTRSTFAPIPETAECAPEQERRQRFDHSLFELTMQEGCTVDGKIGRNRRAGFVPPFPGAPIPASRQAQAEKFLLAVSGFIPGVSANHESRYTTQVRRYLDDMEQHPTVEVVKRPSNRPRKPEMLQLFIRVEDEKAWDSMDVWESNSVFSM